MTVFSVGALPRLGLEPRTFGQHPNALTVRPFDALRPFEAVDRVCCFEKVNAVRPNFSWGYIFSTYLFSFNILRSISMGANSFDHDLF